MKETPDDVNARDGVGNRRTRSQAAPEWTVTESLILVNEIAAVEADCSVALSSYQQWEIIAGNCAALDVGRNLAQCRRKWGALLAEYDDFRRRSSKKTCTKLDPELFDAIERVVKAREERGQIDHESDTEQGNEDDLDATVEIGPRRKRQQSKSERYRVQKPKRYRPVESSEDLEERPEESHEEESDNNIEEEYLKDFLQQKSKLKCTAKRRQNHIEMPLKSLVKVELNENCDIEKPKPTNSVGNITISREEDEEMLTLKLQELAIEIEAISAESADCKAANSQNIEDYHTEFTRRQGDKLIASLGNFSSTLKQLCDLLQECK